MPHCRSSVKTDQRQPAPSFALAEAPEGFSRSMSPESLQKIQAAHGFFELGMWQASWDELETMGPEDRAELPVAVLRVEILKAMKRWESAAILAESLIEKGAKIGGLYLSAAYAIRRARSLPEAKAMLLKGEPFLQDEALWWYNLACYDCQLGDLEAAKARLARAFEIDRDYRLRALEDEDLKPLWDAFAGELGDHPSM